MDLSDRPTQIRYDEKTILNHLKRLDRNKDPPLIFQKWLIEHKIEPMLSPENFSNSEVAIKMLAPTITNKQKWSRLELRAEIIIASFQSIQVVVVQAIYLGQFLERKQVYKTLFSIKATIMTKHGDELIETYMPKILKYAVSKNGIFFDHFPEK